MTFDQLQLQAITVRPITITVTKWEITITFYALQIKKTRSVNLSKSSFICQLLINPSSKAFDSDQV